MNKTDKDPCPGKASIKVEREAIKINKLYVFLMISERKRKCVVQGGSVMLGLSRGLVQG